MLATWSWVTYCPPCTASPQWPLENSESLSEEKEVEKCSDESDKILNESNKVLPMHIPRPWLASISLRGELRAASRNRLISGLQQSIVCYQGGGIMPLWSHTCHTFHKWQEGFGKRYMAKWCMHSWNPALLKRRNLYRPVRTSDPSSCGWTGLAKFTDLLLLRKITSPRFLASNLDLKKVVWYAK